MFKSSLTLLIGCILSTTVAQAAPKALSALNTVDELKTEILKISQSFQGQGDPDFAIQDLLTPYVDKLIQVAPPQKPAAQRLDVIAGRWQQVWGPYEFRKNDGSVEPTLDPTKVFQVVFEDGYYYNVSNNFRENTQRTKNTGLLRGEFEAGEGNFLNVQFTNLCRINRQPLPGQLYTDLPALAEAGDLANVQTVLPGFLVRWFLGSGQLEEVYTDEDIRLAYGRGEDQVGRPSLFVLKRVP